MHTSPLFGGFQVRENGLWLSDSTEWNVSTSRHGFMPKLPGDTSKYYRGDGQFAALSAGAAPPPNDRYVSGVEWASGVVGQFVNNGIPSPSGTGTTTNGDDSDGHAIQMNINAAAGTPTNRRSSAAFSRQGESAFYCRIKTGSDITACSLYFGFSSTIHSGTGQPSGHAALWRYHTTDDGTAFWRTMTRDGTTPFVTTTSEPIAASTLYELAVEMDPSECRFTWADR